MIFRGWDAVRKVFPADTVLSECFNLIVRTASYSCVFLMPEILYFYTLLVKEGEGDVIPEHKKVHMETTRQKKVSRLLQKELGQIIQHRSIEAGGKLITVTTVRISPDLSVAKIYLSIFPPKDTDKTLDALKELIPQIRHELGNLVRHQLRIVPELVFYIDDSLDYIEKIENLLK